MSALRILIVDDHEVVRRGLRSLLASRRDWEVCGEAADGIEAVEKAKSLRPDLALMDISMPLMNGLDATRIIRREVPECQVVIVSMNDQGIASQHAREVNAAGYVAKSETPQTLVSTIEALVDQREAAVRNGGVEVAESTGAQEGESVATSVPDDAVPLESILCTEELRRRPARAPDYEKENRALVALAQALADSPRTILQTLADTILDVLQAGSAGISLLTTHDGGKRFYWPAIAGRWKPHIGGGTPRDFGPCGDVLDRNVPLLFRHIERRYTYFQPVTPPVEECLLVPFYVEGKAVGTIWAIAHDAGRKFDAEDERVMTSLGKFASSAYQIHASLDALQFQVGEREKVEAALRLDITERKEVERAANLLAAIVDSSDDAIISKSLQGVITSWNKSAERLFGHSAEEAIGQHITLIIPPDRRDEETTILARLKRGERVDHFETIRMRKDGTLRDISLTISPVRDDAGRVVGASKVARDITERKRIEQTLAERALLLDLSNDAIFVRDVADRITYWNRGALELYGYTREEALGRVSHELLRTEFPEPLDRITKQLQHEGRWTGELVHTRKDGTQIVAVSRWVLDRDERGYPKRVLETNNDITQQRRNEKALRDSENRLRALADTLETQVRARTAELEQRNREVLEQSEQLRELSHRLIQIQDNERRRIARELHDSAGQNLAALSMNLSNIVRQAKEIAPQFAKEAEEAQELVRELSQEIRTTSYLLHPPLLDESGLPEALSWYIQGLKERSGLDIQLSIARDFGRLSSEMELVIFRVVQECLTNVLRHSGSKVAAIRIAREGQSISVEVEDEGQGISPERLAEIQSRGTGVGMRGMRERVLQLGGELRVQSEARGTKISATFPVVENVDPKTAEPGQQARVAR